MATYRAAGRDWPRSKAKAGSEEHQLGVWLHAQRMRQRSGKLTPARAQSLNATVPGWRTGRKRKAQS
ncbi:helicase associated domain-containing protein [Arthrobacter sp. ISL-65]|nr:helicase associated domain-containing protein [Arthrobacter sp. ISL-65]